MNELDRHFVIVHHCDEIYIQLVEVVGEDNPLVKNFTEITDHIDIHELNDFENQLIAAQSDFDFSTTNIFEIINNMKGYLK